MSVAHDSAAGIRARATGDGWHDSLLRRSAVSVLLLHVVGDWASTVVALRIARQHGIAAEAGEANPLIGTIAHQPLLMLGVMAGIGGATVAVLAFEDWRLATGRSGQTRIGRGLLWVSIASGVAILVLNVANALVIALGVVG